MNITPEQMATWFQRDRMAVINCCLEDALACRSIKETMEHLTEVPTPQIVDYVQSSTFYWDDKTIVSVRTNIRSTWRYEVDYVHKGIHIFGPVSPYRENYEDIEAIVVEHVLGKLLRYAYKKGG